MRKLSIAALFCVSFAAAPGAFAQSFDVVFSVEGWPGKKFAAQSFSFATQAPQPSAKSTVRNFELSMALGDSTRLFMQTALEGQSLKTMLFEAFPHGAARQVSPAPFAVRLSDVSVTTVQVNMEGTMQIKLQASMVEFLTATQQPTGVATFGSRFLWNNRLGVGG